jgi:hypothetical protein
MLVYVANQKSGRLFASNIKVIEFDCKPFKVSPIRRYPIAIGLEGAAKNLFQNFMRLYISKPLHVECIIFQYFLDQVTPVVIN